MSLPSTTITATRPPAIVAGDNPIVVSLSTGDLGTAGYARGKVKVLSTSTNNLTLTFNLTGGTAYNKVFIGKEYPNNDSYFLTGTLKDADGNTIDSSISTSEIANSIADCLKKDIVISKDYFINYSGSTIIELIAKEPSTKFSLAGQVVSSNPSNISFTSISAGSDEYEGANIPDYSLFVEVYKGNNSLQLGDIYSESNFDRVTEVVLPFSNDNVHLFDLSTVCKSFVGTTKPEVNATGFTTDQNASQKYVLPFAFTYGESYPLVSGTNTNKKRQKGTTAQIWVCNASLPLANANALNSFTGSSDVKFLTNQPVSKKSTRNSRELLYLLIKKDYGTGLNVRADIKFWDGTSNINQTLYTIFGGSTNYGGLYCLNVSHEFELLSFEATKKIKEVEISVPGYSVIQKYRYPFTDPANRVGIAFKNSLGTFDTFDFVGIAEETIDRTKRDLTSPLSINSDGSISKGFKYSSNYDVQITKRQTLNSGFIDEQHFDWLIEMMKSNEIYQYDSTGLNFMKLDSYKYSKNTQTNEYSIEVTFMQTIFENTVSV